MVGCKESSGANEKSNSCLVRASSTSHLPDFSGLLRNPWPAAQTDPRLACAVCQTSLQPRSSNDGFSRQCCASSIAANGNPPVELARSGGFSFAAYFWSTIQGMPYPINWRKLPDSEFNFVRPQKVFAQLSLESAYPIPPSNFCF